VETVNVDATGEDVDIAKTYTLDLTDDALKTLTVAGNDKVDFTAASAMTSLTTINASANIAGVTIDTSDSALTQAITITGTGKADTFVLGANDVVSGNGGNDTFTITVAASPTGQKYATITDANKNDVLDFGADVTKGSKVTLAATAVFQDYLDAAAAGNATNVASWFTWGGDTYVVVDRGAGATFTNGTDVVVKLAGVVDLSLATESNGDLVLG
jgi:S-layer protein